MNSDNKFGECCNCPAKMSDARLFTNYLSTSQITAHIKETNSITDEHQYRLFLQKNGSSIMNNEKDFLRKNKMCDMSKR